jgi:hypothetical protein
MKTLIMLVVLAGAASAQVNFDCPREPEDAWRQCTMAAVTAAAKARQDAFHKQVALQTKQDQRQYPQWHPDLYRATSVYPARGLCSRANLCLCAAANLYAVAAATFVHSLSQPYSLHHSDTEHRSRRLGLHRLLLNIRPFSPENRQE